jgi:signal peptidase II
MSLRSRLPVFAGTIALVFAIDQAVKVWARATLPGRPPREWLGGMVRIEYAENRGAFLSLGADLPDAWRAGLLIGLTLVGLVALAIYVLRTSSLDRTHLYSASFLTAGGLSNLADRIARDGVVTDFVSMGIGPLRTGIFNVADVCILAGAIALFLLSFRQTSPSPPSPPSQAPAERGERGES